MQTKTRTMQILTGLLLAAFLLSLTASTATAVPVITYVTISDVRSNAFTVSWTTDEASNGVVTWGTSKPPTHVVTDPVSSTTTHYVEVLNLTPNTTYYFQVSSGGVVDNNGGQYFEVETGPVLISNPGLNIWGYVFQSDGVTPVPNAIVYLQLQDTNSAGSLGLSQLVSTRSASNGAWAYNLSNVRESNFQSLFTFTSGVDRVLLVGQGGAQGAFGFDPQEWITIPTSNWQRKDIILSAIPTAVTFEYFRSAKTAGGVELTWKTTLETDTLGYHLYRREPGGVFQKINASLIPSAGLTTGSIYTYLDASAEPGTLYEYQLEAVSTSLHSSQLVALIHWPYSIFIPAILK